MPVIELITLDSTDAVKSVDKLSRLIKNFEKLNEDDFGEMFDELDTINDWVNDQTEGRRTASSRRAIEGETRESCYQFG